MTVEEQLPDVIVTAFPPVGLPNGQEVLVTPLPGSVRLETYNSSRVEEIAARMPGGLGQEEENRLLDAAKLSDREISYEEYEQLRRDNPGIDYPELRKPEKNLDRIRPNNYPEPGSPGNTLGVILPKTETFAGEEGSDPPVQPETEEEHLWDDFMKGGEEGAQYYDENISEALHEFGGNATDVGGSIAMGGGAIAAAGAALSATGAGAVVGVPMAAVGAAVAAVGGGVAAAGVVVDALATGLDTLSEAIRSRESPDVIGAAITQAERTLNNLLFRKLDKLDKLSGKGKGKDGGGGGYVKKKKPNSDPLCKLKPYRKNKEQGGCPAGDSPHHVVPDHVFKEKGGGGSYYPGTPNHADGLTICLKGATKSTAADGNTRLRKQDFRGRIREYFRQLAAHGRVHARLDSREIVLAVKGSPFGTTTLREMEKAGARAIAKETGCDQKYLEKQLRDFHKGPPYSLPPETRVRADPFGMFSNPPFEMMGRPDKSVGSFDVD
ncbi:MAG: hypothetical protein LBI92_06235 [Azoarcus sp.]|nr:hypothetical protein [Azoarcus sp.]